MEVPTNPLFPSEPATSFSSNQRERVRVCVRATYDGRLEFESSFVIMRPKGKKIGLRTTTPDQKTQFIDLVKLQISKSTYAQEHTHTERHRAR